MENQPLPAEIIQEAEALLGLEMPADPKSKDFEQWLLRLYEEDAGLAAALVEQLSKPTPKPPEPGVMEQERRRLQRQEDLSRWWQGLWSVENQYGEWVPNQKRRLAAGFAALALAFGVFLLVIGQKPLEEKKLQGNLGSISGLVAQGGPQNPDDPVGAGEAALLPGTGDSPQGTPLLGAVPGASLGAGTGPASSASSTDPTPGFGPSGAASDPSAQTAPDDFSPRVYPPTAAGSGGVGVPSAPHQSPTGSPVATASPSPSLASQPPTPTQPVPVMIRQPEGKLPTVPQQATALRQSPPLAAKSATTESPEALQGRAGAAPSVSAAQSLGVPLAVKDQNPSPWQAVRPTAAGSSAMRADGPVSTGGSSPARPTAQPLSAQGGPLAGGAAYTRLPQQTPQDSSALAYSRPAQPAPASGQMVQLSSSPPPTPPNAPTVQAPSTPNGPSGEGSAAGPVSPLSLPSLQTPTNLAQGFDPGKPVEALLDTHLLLVEGVGVLARAVTPDGAVWLGQASLDPLRRVAIEFKEVFQGGQRIPVSALAYDAEHNPGLAAEFKDENPSLVQDLLRQGAQAANGYLQSLLQAGQTTAVPGGGAVQDRSAPPLEWVLLGELGKLFTLPQPQNSFVRTARVPKGTPVLIYLSPTK